MAPTPTASPEFVASEGELLGKLLGLYDEERQLYERVLELSHRQCAMVRRGAPLPELRRLLEQKQDCLAIIARLEGLEAATKAEWERRRHEFSRAARARLRAAVQQVADLIEQILACEETNDQELIEQSRAV